MDFIRDNEVETDLSPFIRVYKNGRVERLFGTPHVPPSLDDPTTDVSSKDIIICPGISARLYLPKLIIPNQKLPILVYYHCGGFCLESAFSFAHHRYLNLFVSQAKAVSVSVEYRQAPEHPLPTAYEDSWTALQWVSAHFSAANSATEKEPWLVEHGDFSRIYIGGDSAGGNIAHQMVLRAGTEPLGGNAKIFGAFLSHPYFLGSSNTPKPDGEISASIRTWMFVYPSAPGGIDNPMINPLRITHPAYLGLDVQSYLSVFQRKMS